MKLLVYFAQWRNICVRRMSFQLFLWYYLVHATVKILFWYSAASEAKLICFLYWFWRVRKGSALPRIASRDGVQNLCITLPFPNLWYPNALITRPATQPSLRSIVCTYYPPETGGSLATQNPKPWRRFNFEWGRRDLKLNQRAAMLDDKRGCYFNPPEAPGAHVESEAEPNERHSRRGKMKRSKNLIYFDWHIPVSLPRKMVSLLLNLIFKS